MKGSKVAEPCCQILWFRSPAPYTFQQGSDKENALWIRIFTKLLWNLLIVPNCAQCQFIFKSTCHFVGFGFPNVSFWKLLSGNHQDHFSETCNVEIDRENWGVIETYSRLNRQCSQMPTMGYPENNSEIKAWYLYWINDCIHFHSKSFFEIFF